VLLIAHNDGVAVVLAFDLVVAILRQTLLD